MHSIFLAILSFCCIFGNPRNSISPYFSSKPSEETVEIGGKVRFRCKVENLGESTLIWKKDGRMISAGERLIRKDARMALIDYNLEISEVTEEDRGEYICNVETFGDPLDQAHRLEVLVPPSIQSQPKDGKFVVRAGSTITLECQARGNPTPTITWTRKNLMLPNGEKILEGKSLVIQQVSRHHNGHYVCAAENGVGQQAKAEIDLQVLYPPEIVMKQSWIKSNGGIEAEVSCVVHAEPAAKVKWYKNTMILDQTENRRMEDFGKKHRLLLTNMNRRDFGNYSCMADNSLGRGRESIEVSGRPHEAVVVSPEISPYDDQYNLIWKVDSFLKIEECRILHRKIESNAVGGEQNHLSDWTNIIPTMNADSMSSSPMGLTFKGQFMFYGLEPETDYEVIIQTRNKEGWSDPSNIFKFRTRQKGYDPLEMQLTDKRSFFHSNSAVNQVASLIGPALVLMIMSRTILL